MTINKPEVVAYLHTNKENPEHRGVSLHHDASCASTLTNTEPLIRLSDCEALQAECEKLRKDADQYRRLIELIKLGDDIAHGVQQTRAKANFIGKAIFLVGVLIVLLGLIYYTPAQASLALELLN